MTRLLCLFAATMLVLGLVSCDLGVDSERQSNSQFHAPRTKLIIELVSSVFVGQPITVSVTMVNDPVANADIGGFDFLISYDASAMAFQYAEEGDFLTDCEWEYFAYRFGPNATCGGNVCPNGTFRVVAVAETSSGDLAHHPACYTKGVGVSQELVNLHFLASTDANLECDFAPIRWIWYDCADNSLSSPANDSLYISGSVYNFVGFDGGASVFDEIHGLDQNFPTLTGAPDVCDVFTEYGQPVRLVHFYNGGLDFICADPIDAVGDINLNGLAYEIADAVMFSNYFINGLSAFGGHVEGSIAASDTNKDGVTLSVADLVYLIRVVTGDAAPGDPPPSVPVTANVTFVDNTLSVDVEMGAAYIVVEGNVTPALLADNMEMKYASNGEITRILVYSLEPDQSFTGDFLQVNGNVISTEFATSNGQPVVGKVLPATFVVEQNYPNPFCPTTKIDFVIPGGGPWSLKIVDIRGRRVLSQSGVSETGFETIVWDASGLSPGVFTYTVTVGNLSESKKATLLCK